ncbi:MAG: Antitoxin Phd YefM, type toxin-antitoxin system [Pseudomonadota bacterium]|jgi:prevent-host-death family protein
MRTYSTNEARNKFSEMIDNSQHEAVEIIRHGRTMSVLLSKKDFERLKKIEDDWWMSQSITPSKNKKKEILNTLKDDEWIEDPLV